MIDWNDFQSLNETDQASYLVEIAESSLFALEEFPKIREKVKSYLILASRLLDGASADLNSLILFLDDPEMEESFVGFYEEVGYSGNAAACLDIATYASAFVCRLIAEKQGVKVLPDPVIEAVPDIYEFYRDKAQNLGL